MNIRKPLLTAFICMTAFAFLQAEKNSADTVTVYNLDEIEVKASKVIRKADMDVYHPSQSAAELSANGLQLLSRLSIPSLFIDEVMGNVKSAGGNVQMRINGRIASIDQVRNLEPSSIKRVEWIDNPGLRYEGAECVLNIIVSNPTQGGSLMASAQTMMNVVFGNYFANLKLNSGKSQWEISGYFKPCESSKLHREYHETFTYPDGFQLTRIETPINGKVKNYQGNASLSYSYIKPDTTIFYALLHDWSNLDDLYRFKGSLSLSNNQNPITLLNDFTSKGHTPSLSLYLEQHFTRSQILVVDFSASLYAGRSSTNYRESYEDSDIILNDIYTHIKDLNQAYAIETDYIKNWENSKFTTGINYSANRNRSRYLNLGDATFHQRQDKVYFFGEYFRKIRNFTFTVGLGAQYTDFRFKESDQGSIAWNLRPQATITYSPNFNHQFRLNFSSWQNTPSLEETNIAPQQTDGFQWNIGNPDLKTYNTYRLNFRYGFNFWRISGNFNIYASTSPKSIAQYLFWQDDRLITTYENSHGKQALSFKISPQIQIVPEWLMLSGSIEYLNERTQGNGYKLYNHNWNGNVQAMLSHWNFTLLVQYFKAPRTLIGEKLSWGEDISGIGLLYDWKDWQFGAIMFMPFGQYDQGSKMLSKWNTNEEHLRLDFRMIGITINYNLQWGKQKHGVNKLVESEANVDKSSAKTR